MTLHKIQKVFVDEKKLMTKKELTMLVLKLGLSFIGIVADLGLLTVVTVGLPFTVVVVFGAIFAFNWVWSMLDEDEESLKGVKVFSNLFFVYYLILVAELFVLHLNRFI